MNIIICALSICFLSSNAFAGAVSFVNNVPVECRPCVNHCDNDLVENAPSYIMDLKKCYQNCVRECSDLGKRKEEEK